MQPNRHTFTLTYSAAPPPTLSWIRTIRSIMHQRDGGHNTQTPPSYQTLFPPVLFLSAPWLHSMHQTIHKHIESLKVFIYKHFDLYVFPLYLGSLAEQLTRWRMRLHIGLLSESGPVSWRGLRLVLLRLDRLGPFVVTTKQLLAFFYFTASFVVILSKYL